MLVLEVLLAVFFLIACSFAPGFFFVRRLRWTAMEKLCASVGASLILCYLSFVAVYLVSQEGRDVSRPVLCCFSACSLAFCVFARRDIARLLHSFRVRQTLQAFCFLLLWTFLVLLMIRNYSGTNWLGDWLEHFQRTLFFVHHFPKSSPIVFGYELSARPPAMNELAAFFLGQLTDRFEIFQVIFGFLNLLIFLPCCLIMPALAGKRKTFLLPLALLFAANPAVMQQVTYTWTKALTAFFVVLSFGFYLAGMRKNDHGRILAGFVFVSFGMLVHYSAGPYLVFLTIHYFWRVLWQRPARQRLRETATILIFCGALWATWFGWSIAVYGMRTTFASNTTVTANRQLKGQFLTKTASNLADSVVPAILRFDPLTQGLSPQGFLPALRDRAFALYQPNLIFGMGIFGGPIIVWLAYRGLLGANRRTEEWRFWCVAIPVSVALGIASTGERDPRGVAHLTLFSLQAIGLSLLASTFPWRRRVLWLILAGCAIDFAAGILLHAYVQNLENDEQKTVYAALNSTGGKPNDAPVTPDSVGGLAWDNWYLKHQYTLNAQALASLDRAPTAGASVGRGQIERSLAEDESYWHGWYARNGGSVKLLGDHFWGQARWRIFPEISALLALLGAAMGMVLKRNALLLKDRWLSLR